MVSGKMVAPPHLSDMGRSPSTPQSSRSQGAGGSTRRGLPVASQVHAGYHPCRGWGAFAMICPVMIPDGRTLCHFCARSSQLPRPAIRGPIQCPTCPGDITEPGHFETLDHRLGFMNTDDAHMMAQIARANR